VLKFCANVSWLFREVPFLERPEAARCAGFSGIEFHSPEGHTSAEISQAARDAGVGVVLFNAWPADFLQGGCGLSGVPGREAEFRQAVTQACDFGAALDGGAHVQIGQSRVPAGVSRDECMQVYVENLRYAAAELAQAGCRVLVEPMNATDCPAVLVPDVPTAIGAIAKAGDPRIGLQLDVYHHHMSGADVDMAIADLGPRIAHLQFSDAPGRHEPGTGRIKFDTVFAALDRQCYPHWVAAEYRPSRPTAETLDWLSVYLSSHNAAPEGK
jgi:hydroxypyruvate isomerase